MVREQKPRNTGIIERSLLPFEVLADQTVLNREIEFVTSLGCVVRKSPVATDR